MSDADTSLRDLARAHGVHLGFADLHGTYHEAGPETLRALLRGLGIDVGGERTVTEALAGQRAAQADRNVPEEVIVAAREPARLRVGAPCDWHLETETGEEAGTGRAEDTVTLPPCDAGFYILRTTGRGWTGRTRVLCRPSRAPRLAGQTGLSRCWGVTGPLYGLRSAGNGGLGNFADLAQSAAALGGLGAQFLGINPVHALGWARKDIVSPYSPSHRGFLNIDHIAVPGGLGQSPASGLVDYPAFRARHRQALESAFADEVAGAALEQAPEVLRDFAAFEALSEAHGTDFRRWPAALRQPGPAARHAAGPRALFHVWLQLLAERQIAAAQAAACGGGMALGLYLDLAVGPRPDGAEVWMNADTIARGVTIGAPSDHLNPEGQSWGLAAHAPGPLAAADYMPLRRILRKLMSHCGLLRIDHALGLMRSFWLPEDGSPGGYVSQPLDSLLAVIAIEADRAGCLVVGEDLGLVPQGLRQKLKDAGLYSYAVWQFESDGEGEMRAAGDLPPQVLACFGTHDTPTLRGFWYGRDIDLWHRMGWVSGGDRDARHRTRSRQRGSLRRLCGIAADAPAPAISDRIQSELARSPAEMVSIQLEDALGLVEAQNLPGTIDEHPNWRRRLPLAVEDFASSPDLRHAATLMPADRQRTRKQDRTA